MRRLITGRFRRANIETDVYPIGVLILLHNLETNHRPKIHSINGIFVKLFFRRANS